MFSSKKIEEKKILSALSLTGFYLLPQKLEEKECDNIISKIDSYITLNKVEENYNSSEFRIWKSHNKIKEIEPFLYFANSLLSPSLTISSKPSSLLIFFPAFTASLYAFELFEDGFSPLALLFELHSHP